MKRGTLTLALAGIALALAAPITGARAEPPAAETAAPFKGHEDGAGMMHHDAAPNDRDAGHHHCQDADAHRAALLAFAEVKLQITEAQKPVWTKFAETVRAAGQAATKLCAEGAGKTADVTLPERLARDEQVAQAKLTEIQTIRPALDDLYAQLTPEQRKVADGLPQLCGFGHHHPMHHD